MKINFEIFQIIFYLGISIQTAFGSPEIHNTLDDIHKQDVLDYVNELKANADLSEDPCNNFRKYACGSMHHKKPLSVWNWNTLIYKYFIETESKTETDKLIRDYLIRDAEEKSYNGLQDNLSKIEQIWSEIDYLKTVKTFPVTKENANSKTIGELAASLSYLPTKGLFYIRSRPNLEIEIHAHFRDIPPFNEDLFIQIAKMFKRETDEVEDIIKKVKNFIDEANRIETSEIEALKHDNEIHITSFKEFKQMFPSEHLDWDGFHDALINHAVFVNTNDIIVINPNLFKSVIKLIDETDRETILNFQLYSAVHLYLIDFQKATYMFSESLGRLAVLNKIWEENLSTNRTIDRFNKFLDKFETSLNKMNEKYKNNNFDYIQDFIKNKRLVLKNHKTYVNTDILNEYYGKFKPNQYYKTAQILLDNSLKKFIEYTVHNDTENIKLWGGSFNMAIPLNAKNKPYIFYYAKGSADIYNQYYRFYRSYEKEFPMQECATQLKIEQNIDSFLFDSAVVKSILMIDNLNELLQDEYKLLAEINEDPMKLFFIALTQDECRRMGNEESEYTVEKTFPYIPEFMDAFKCPKGTNMNHEGKNICKLPECDTTKFKQELLPFKIEC